MDSTAITIKEIMKFGKSKYWIAKNVGVTWQTVHMWSRGVFFPNREHVMKLELALKIAKEKQ